MPSFLNSLGPLQWAFIAITGLFLTAFLLFLILRKDNQNFFKASDGKLFSDEESRNTYEATLQQVKNLFYNEDKKVINDIKYGFQEGFLNKLRETAFTDASVLLRYKKDFEKLVVFFDQEISS